MPLRSRDLTIISVFPLRLIEYGAVRGLDREALLAPIGLSMSELAEPGRHIPAHLMFDLYAQVMRELQDPAVPFHIAQATTMEDLHVMGFAVLTAHNGREAIHRAVRYARLLTNSSRWEAIESDGRAIIRFHRELAPTLGIRAANEAALGDFISGTQQIHGAEVRPLRVSLRHSAPPDTSAHEAFYRCPIEFDAPYNEFELPPEIYDRPIANNPALSDFFARHAEELLQAAHVDDSVQAQVRHEIAEALPSGDLTLPRVAKRLAMSERSLRRHLNDEGTSFTQLVADVRYDQARTLLRAPRVSLDEVAYLLGFSNVSAFSRAFKKWSGRAPGEYRSELGQGAGAGLGAGASA